MVILKSSLALQETTIKQTKKKLLGTDRVNTAREYKQKNSEKLQELVFKFWLGLGFWLELGLGSVKELVLA